MKSRAVEAAMAAFCAFACPSGARAQPFPPEGSRDGRMEVLFAEVVINGGVQKGQYVIGRRDGVYLVSPADLSSWRIRTGLALPEAEAARNPAFVPLPAGVSAAFEEAEQRLVLTVPPELFAPQRLAPRDGAIPPTQGAFAAFLNYDLSLQYARRMARTGFFELGLSDSWGLAATTMAVGRGAGRRGAVRLDSYHMRDDPEDLTRLVIGDSITDAPDWSRQVRFGGVRFGTEFGLRPSLVTFPTPTFAGRTAVPSNVELFVNDAARFQTDVDRGPFSIDQVPLVTGAGEAVLVVRDILGIERRIRTPYYVSSRLLAKGLSAWSLEAGAERRGYGLRSFGYGNPFTAGSYRRGLADWLTLEARGEFSGDVRMAGAGANAVWSPVGEFAAAVAASQGKDGAGGLYRISFNRIAPAWNLGISYQRASRGFDQLGVARDGERITRQLQATGGFSLKGLGNLAVAWTDLEHGDGRRSQVASANYSLGIGDRGFVNVFGLRSRFQDQGSDMTLGLGLTIPFGGRGSAYLQADNRSLLGEVRRPAPTDGGWGYRFAASAGETKRQQVQVEWRGDIGEASLEAARFGSRESARLVLGGGVLLAGGGAYATRRVEGGLGVVDVPGLANVRVYQENRLVTRTDAHGRAIIPDLRAYEANHISLAPSDLPLSVRMPEDAMVVVPRARGAALARFAIEQDNPATVVLAMPDGRPVEAGTTVRAANGETLFVGYGGEVFLRKAAGGLLLEIEIGAPAPCRVRLPEIAPAGQLPRIGPLVCFPGKESGE